MKIVVSGWSGSGSSTLAILLALILEIKLFKATDAFRLLWDKLGYGQTGENIIKADNEESLIEPYFGPLFDKLVDETLVNSDLNLVLESDIAAFRLGKRSEFFSIFLTPSLEARKARLQAGGRAEDVDVLEKRDLGHQAIYKKLTGLDFLSLEDIKQKYNLVIDNSNMPLDAELRVILNQLKTDTIISSDRFDELIRRIDEVINRFESLGSKAIVEEMKNDGEVIDGKYIISEIVRKHRGEIENFPEELKNAILSI